MLNPQESGKLHAKRHYVILAKALGWYLASWSWLCNAVLRQDDIVSLGIKSSAFLSVEHPFARKI